MSEILPLLLLPAVAGWCLSEWKQRRMRSGLRSAIAQARRPLLHDAGVASVVAVARSLETHAREERPCPWWMVGRARITWEVRELAAPLGLTLDDVIGLQRDRLGRVIGFVGASQFSGERHGRPVAVSLGVDASTISIEIPGAELSSFAIVPDADGGLTGAGSLPLAVDAALHTLAASRRWRELRLVAHGERITLERPASSPGSWLHDLWLVEFVADLVAPAAPSPVARRVSAPGAVKDAASPSPSAAVFGA